MNVHSFNRLLISNSSFVIRHSQSRHYPAWGLEPSRRYFPWSGMRRIESVFPIDISRLRAVPGRTPGIHARLRHLPAKTVEKGGPVFVANAL